MKQILFAFILILESGFSFSQCSWSDYSNDSFEYTTTINGIVANAVYQSTPQTYAGCIRTGSRGMYLNIVNGYIGTLFSRQYENLCLGKEYRFSFSVRDAWSSSNNLSFNVYDGNNVLITSQTIVTNSVWQDITMTSFIATTTSVRFEIVTNLAGGPGNDAGIDDLAIEWCNPNPYNASIQQCASGNALDLYSFIQASNLSNNGVWTGPSNLSNGYLGTFNSLSNINGNYTYTVDGGLNCPDSIANIEVTLVNNPNINSFNPVEFCSSGMLPAITGTDLTGQQRYYTQPNGQGTSYLAGQPIASSQTLYAYDGMPGCSDQETINIIVNTPVNAGFDNSAFYCSPGQQVALQTFLSANASAGGQWSVPGNIISGSFNSTSNIWNTSNASAGNYSFTYTVNGPGNCPDDNSVMTITIDNMPEPDLGPDTTLCAGQTMWLNPGAFNNYLWNNGSTNPSRFVNAPGIYWVRVGMLGDNQVVNGNFEQGSTGFTTSYSPGNGGTWGTLSNPGTYAVSSSPNLVHNNFQPCQDQTAAPGTNMLIVNGSNQPNSQVWCQNVPVQPNTAYQFGAWATSVENTNNVALLQFSVNGSNLGSVFSPGNQSCSWTQFFQTWNSGVNTSAQICLVNQNTTIGGNDFAIDEITFRPICYAYDTIQVNYVPNPTVNLGIDQNLCEGTIFTVDAQNPGSSFVWSNGEETQQIEIIESGTYNVQVTSPFGCIAVDAITVNYENQKDAGNDSSLVICSTLSNLDLNNALSQGADGDGLWSTQNFDGSLNDAGQISFNNEIGNFEFVYMVSGNLCPNDSAIINLIINQQPLAANDQNLHLCNATNETISLAPYLNHPQNPAGGYWQINSLPSNALDETNIELFTNDIPHGNYQLNYILNADSSCIQDTTIIELQITATPQISFIPSVLNGCQPLEVVFESTSQTQGNIQVFWDLGEGNYSSEPNGVSVIYQTANCNDVTLTITADGLCTNQLNMADLICVYPLPVAEFTYSPQQVFSFDPTVQFENNSIENYSNQWYFGDGTESSSTNPVHTYPIGEIGSYLVELFVETQHGCTDSTHAIVVVRDELLYYIPNTFTPDSDEFNQVFQPVFTAGFDSYDFQMEIYNRWGELLFVSNDINSGWDGTFNGVIVQDGTYTYKIEAGLLDTDEKIQVHGHVNLLR